MLSNANNQGVEKSAVTSLNGTTTDELAAMVLSAPFQPPGYPFSIQRPGASQYEQVVSGMATLSIAPNHRNQVKKMFSAVFDDVMNTCVPCRFTTTGLKQLIMHFCSDVHKQNAMNPAIDKRDVSREATVACVNLFDAIVQIWRKEDDEKAANGSKKFENMSQTERAQLTPLASVLNEIEQKINEAFVPIINSPNRAMRYERQMAYYSSAAAKNLMDRLHCDIVKGKPWCPTCEVVCDDAEDFYRHVCTYDHAWKQSRSVKRNKLSSEVAALITFHHYKKYDKYEEW